MVPSVKQITVRPDVKTAFDGFTGQWYYSPGME
jgi:hypothetical protein